MRRQVRLWRRRGLWMSWILNTHFFFNFLLIFALQYCVSFCHSSTWISHRYTYVPSLLNLPPISFPIPSPGWYQPITSRLIQSPKGTIFSEHILAMIQIFNLLENIYLRIKSPLCQPGREPRFKVRQRVKVYSFLSLAPRAGQETYLPPNRCHPSLFFFQFI